MNIKQQEKLEVTASIVGHVHARPKSGSLFDKAGETI
jgi:hypothetical protein